MKCVSTDKKCFFPQKRNYETFPQTPNFAFQLGPRESNQLGDEQVQHGICMYSKQTPKR